MNRSGRDVARTAGVLATLSLAGLGPAGAQEPAEQKGVVGHWVGTLSAMGTELRLVFHIERNGEDGLSGTMDSPDQGAYDLRLSSVTDEDGAVVFSLASLGGEYRGQLSSDGSSIEGSWSQGGATFPLPLERSTAEALAPERPQEPQPPLPYESVDVQIDNDEAAVRLAGTLTIPAGQGPHPAVVLISGSGPQDRDETVFGHRPFLVLADHLTQNGVAVLRYDDRGIGESTGDFGIATTLDFVSDALAAAAFLADRPEVDPAKVGFVGHSEGAIVAPLAANRSDGIAFAVLLASTGVDGRELLVMQGKAINRASGVPEAVLEERARVQAELLDAVMAADDNVAAAEAARAILASAGVTGAAAEGQVRALLTPWMAFFLTYDPLPALRETSVPVLVLNGELDTQVPPAENLVPVEQALLEGGNGDVTAEVMPRLNHLFQTAETGAPAEYAGIEETFSPVALQRISDWILERM